MELFAPLDKIIQAYLPKEQIKLVERAFVIARDAHEGQYRSSGEPYITHPVAVAAIIAEMRLDHEAVMAALLHDVIEDTPYTEEQLAAEFGHHVAEIVEGVSKLDKLKFRTRQEAQAESFRKMILAMTKDIRVVLIKLADRTHNMRTLGALRPDKRRRIAQETLEIYSPLAHRLGIEHIKNELEDLCFQAMHPQRYAVINRVIQDARAKGKELIQPILDNLSESLHKAGIPSRVYGREKPAFYIYQSIKNHSQKFRTILDIYNFRVVTHNVDDCYRALGCVHHLYKPRAGQIKDYIAVPKTNGYQALHTATIGAKGIPVAVQIRTEEMDKIAKMGVTAHWMVKQDGKTDNTTAQIKAQRWLENIIELQQSAGNSFEFIESVKSDLFSHEIYVFTPKGRIIELPEGATAIDFAYAVHTDVGDSCAGAIVDRADYPLTRPLVSGQTVDIVTSPSAKPRESWLNAVVTGRAKSKIRQALKTQEEQTALFVPACIYHYADCCHPIAGDKVRAYESVSNEWVVHHANCQSLVRHPESIELQIENEGQDFEVELRVSFQNSADLGNLLVAITSAHSNIHSVWSEDDEERSLAILLITAKDTKHLTTIVRKIQSLPNVISVIRNVNA
ncbi:RelA/SpoT family protein [Actinobacillus porcinus]|uniref:RelA/SpoT family protein n=1 Tax=Actinobacillus porcinus TaxID=51048 RepID=UPI002354CA5D|nr:RelA/SpoT family protein [Actinobacillus porcinus]